MVQVSTRPSLFRCAFLAALVSALFVTAVPIVAADENTREKEESAKDKAATIAANQFKLSVFTGLPPNERGSKDQNPVFVTVVTANKPFDFKVKEGRGASGILRENKEGKLHFKGQINMSPGVGVFDLPVDLGRDYLNRSGISSGGFSSFFVKFERAKGGCTRRAAPDFADAEPLILEARAGMNVTLEVMVSAGSDFRVVSTVKGRKWSLAGTVHKVDDGVASVSAMFKVSDEDYSSGVGLSETELKINDLGNSWGAGSWGGIHAHFWIRRSVDPVPALRSMLARRDDTFWHAAWYATELGELKAREAIVPDLIDALSDGIDRSGKQPPETIRVTAARTLGQFGATAKPAVPALVQRLQDDNAYVRIAAAVALWKIKRHAAAVPALIADLKNDAWEIRHNAVGGLGEIAAKTNAAAVVSALTKSFEHDEHTSVRLYAARTLAKLGARAESAVPALTRALNDENKDIQQDARRAIDAIQGRKAAEGGKDSVVPASPDPFDGALSEDASANPFENVSRNPRPRRETAVDRLIKAFEDNDEGIQRSAARKLESIARRSTEQRNRVSYELASYYMQKEEWASAIRWWQAYIPRRSCVELWPSEKIDKITTCQLRLGKLNDACKTIIESRDLPKNRILDLVDAYRLQKELPAFERYLDELLTSDPHAEADEERREVIMRAEVARDYIEMLRMAETGDAAGLWAKIDLPWFGTAMSPIGPVFDFDRSRYATDLLLSLGGKAKPFLMSKLTPPVPEEDQVLRLLQLDQIREERRLAISLLGRLQVVEVLPVIRGEFDKELNEGRAVDCLFAALSIGTDESIAFVNDYATKPEHQAYRKAAMQALDYWQKHKQDK